MQGKSGNIRYALKTTESKSRLSAFYALWFVENAVLSESRKNVWWYSQVFAGYISRGAFRIVVTEGGLLTS